MGSRDSWRHELALLQEELHALDADIAGARAASARARRPTLRVERDEPASAHVHGERLEPDDAGELRRGLKRLSAISCFKRFRAHITDVSPEALDEFVRIDHVRHEALAALDPTLGTIVGVARYVCDPA